MRPPHQSRRGKLTRALTLVGVSIGVVLLDFVWLLTALLLETCDTCGGDEPPSEVKLAVALVGVLASWGILVALLRREGKLALAATLATAGPLILWAVVP